jgi:hypothetical protein
VTGLLASWIQWPDHGGYNFVSGPLADLSLVAAAIAGLAAFWRTHNCHVTGCWRLQWHAHPGHGHPVCRVHHPYGQGRGSHLTPEAHTDHSTWPSMIPNPWNINAAPGSANVWGLTSTASSVAPPTSEELPEPPAHPPKPGTVTRLDERKRKP